MSRVVVSGAGIAGLCTAMVLAEDGHEVVVVERDPAPPGPPDAAWDGWRRRGVAQFRLPHAMLPRFRQELDAELPAAVAALEAAGALRTNRIHELPPAMTAGVRPGDERFDVLTGRRPLVEAAIAHLAAKTPGVTVRRGVAVRAVTTRPGDGAVTHVTGVVTDDGERYAADLVVDAGGRRSTLPDLLEAAGARRPTEEVADSGYVYYARHFRNPDGVMPAMFGPPLHTYTSVQTATLPADHGWWSVVVVASARDRALRRLTDPATWQALLARYPLVAHWVEAEPMTGVEVMARVTDRVRRFVVDGRPVATGVVALGDALACTNPSLGRGLSLAAMHVGCLRRTVREVGTGPELIAAYESRRQAEADGYLADTLFTSSHRLAQLEAHADGVAYEPADPRWTIGAKLLAAAPTDPDLLRGALDVGGLLARGAHVVARPEVASRLAAIAEPAPFPGPDRAEVLAVVGARAAA